MPLTICAAMREGGIQGNVGSTQNIRETKCRGDHQQASRHPLQRMRAHSRRTFPAFAIQAQKAGKHRGRYQPQRYFGPGQGHIKENTVVFLALW
jgi:hypothetical protein